METNLKISVIIPVYNVEDYLVRCVDSITAQTYRNLEIILVDDGSPDGSGRLCDELAQQDGRIRVIHKINGGLSSARNAGIDMATGDVLSFIDSDDWIHPDTYRHLLSLMEQYDADIACMGNMDVSEQTGEQKPALCPKKEECISAEALVKRMFTWDGIDCAACDKIFRRNLFREIRFPIGKVCEDIAIMYRVVMGASRVAMCDQPYYYYFHRPNSLSYSSVSDKTFHYWEHTGHILADVEERYPQLKKEAKYMRVRSLVYNLQQLDLAGSEVRERYQDIYRDSQAELRHSLGFLLGSGMFSRREIAIDTMMAFGVYRFVRKVYHGAKG